MSDPQPTPMADPPEGMTRPSARLPALVGDSALGERTAIAPLAANTVQARASAFGTVRSVHATLEHPADGAVRA